MIELIARVIFIVRVDIFCHDDVIGTRAISFILYLTDPEETWTETDGGALELFDKEEGEPLPRIYLSKFILPKLE